MASHNPESQPLPHDLDGEKLVLGAILADPVKLDAMRPLLDPEDFGSPFHRAIYAAMLGRSDAGQPIDLVFLSRELRASGHPETTIADLTALYNDRLPLADLPTYAASIRNAARLRRLSRTGEDLAKHAADSGADAEALAAAAVEALELARGDGAALQLRPVQECGADPEPVPLIRRAGDHFGSVLAVGEVCILTGPGKVGKSTLARQIALAAASRAGSPKAWQVDVAGLDVRGGAAAMISFEDSDRRTFEACRLLSEDAIPAGLGVLQARGHPLFGVLEGQHLQSRPQRLPAWFRAWSQIRKAKARLVVIDPLGSAFAANSASVEAARAFIDALRTEAERAACGVLLLSHSTKDARKDGKAGDPGQVAGSAAFSDAARAVLVLAHDRLSLELANYSRPFEVDLEPVYAEGKRFAGFREAEPSGRKDAPGNTGITENDV